MTSVNGLEDSISGDSTGEPTAQPSPSTEPNTEPLPEPSSDADALTDDADAGEPSGAVTPPDSTQTDTSRDVGVGDTDANEVKEDVRENEDAAQPNDADASSDTAEFNDVDVPDDSTQPSDSSQPIDGSTPQDATQPEPMPEPMDTGETADSSETQSTPIECIAANPASNSFIEEDFPLFTSDGKSLSATLLTVSEGTCQPVVLLLHQFMQDKEQWGDFPQLLSGAGFSVLRIDLRGHGDSAPQDGLLSELLSDPAQAPLDVSAAVAALLDHPAVDPNRIGIVGTSIGANLSVVAMANDYGVRAIVPVSPRLEAIENLANTSAPFELTTLYCLAGELDNGGVQAETCEQLVAMGNTQSELTIYPDTGLHGVALLDEMVDAKEKIIQWLIENL